MVLNETFWVSLSFLLFVAAIFKPVGGYIVNALDARNRRIRQELDEALELKEKAQALLSTHQRNQKEMVEQAGEIISHAEKEAQRIASESKTALEDALNKRVEMAMQKISAYEASVMQDLRNHSVDIAVSTVRSIIQEHMTSDLAEELVNDAVGDISKKLH